MFSEVLISSLPCVTISTVLHVVEIMSKRCHRLCDEELHLFTRLLILLGAALPLPNRTCMHKRAHTQKHTHIYVLDWYILYVFQHVT